MNNYKTTFHANLSLTEGHPEDTYYFFAGGKRYPLNLHDDESRRQAKAAAPHLAEIADEELTHYTAEPVTVSSEMTTRVHIGRYDSDGIKIVHLASMHIPEPDANVESAPIEGIPWENFRMHHHKNSNLVVV
ncbi:MULTISPECIES: hypothetical protein [unclassified Okeania]|uniref:hypothetical protein n=1 Tax=unclassified Okeania TaxID=2634635 RepID=UPI0013B714B2|nr:MULTISPECIES: hypothetical protein [unclassified Okeania]NEP05260.1 hypothetical protein [Okeania sp. SIO4D6]NEP39106.1 hypothetical protein [Okeania sp. SIO2H7]NET17623.1 hypothetical protein [Okeania sp. SIO1H6]NEP74045.1 hypothetical protein [Okeania sp. SIO2G5]NEP94890.1 hypothetical protein [Okeania sp. SIO2F5]